MSTKMKYSKIVFLVLMWLQLGNCRLPVRLAVVAPHQTDWTWLSTESYYKLTNLGYNASTINLHQIPYVELHDLRDVSMLLNQLRDSGVNCIMGPHNTMVAMAAQTLRVPHLALDVLPIADSYQSNYTVPIVPDATINEMVVEDLIRFHGWKKIGVLYDLENGMHLIGTLAAIPDLEIKGSQIYNATDVKEARRSLIYFRERGFHRVLVLASKACVKNILTQAMYLSMLTQPFHWVLMTMNPYMLDLRGLFDTSVNLTLFRLLRSENTDVSHKVRLNQALATDALQVVYEAAEQLESKPVADSGQRLLNAIKKVKFMGMTGPVQFNTRPTRTNVTIDVLGVNDTGFFVRGLWQEDVSLGNKRLTMSETPQPIYRLKWPMEKEVARVTMILEKPFTMMKDDKNNELRGNARFEGYAVDLIAKLSEVLDFKYEIYLVPDGKFGGIGDNGEWNGMIRELMEGNATMSVAPIAITVTRSQVVDFTKPFKIRHINVLMRRPQAKQNLLQFTYPLSEQVWMLIALAAVVFSVILFVLDRFFPEDASDTTRERYTLKQSAWFVLASLLQTGTESTPSQLPSRILTSSWWFFSLIMVSSYTANLAAFLTMSQIQAPIKSVADLSTRNDLPYGTVVSSGTFSFFQKSTDDVYRAMYSRMALEGRDVLVQSTEEGIQRALNEDFAFIWDSTVTKYIATLNCDVMIIGGAFDPKGYGIGVPKGAQYRDLLSLGILKLDEEGDLAELDRKWWSHGKCGDPAAPSIDSTTSELQLHNVGGIFVVLLGGILMAVGAGMMTFIWEKRRNVARKTNNTSTGEVVPIDQEQNDGQN